jgi:hypothetical protein
MFLGLIMNKSIKVGSLFFIFILLGLYVYADECWPGDPYYPDCIDDGPWGIPVDFYKFKCSNCGAGHICNYYPDVDLDQFFSLEPAGHIVTNDCSDNNPNIPDGYSTEASDCYDSIYSYHVTNTEECNEDFDFRFDPTGDHSWIADHAMMEKDGVYHVFYHHYYLYSILHYSTTDFENWTFEGVVINASESSTDWDDSTVWAPHMIENNGTYYMYYTGVAQHDDGTPDGYSQRIGLLTSSDLYNWERVGVNNCENVSGNGCVYDCRNPWTTHGIPGGWNNQCRDPMIYKDGNRWLMYNTIRRSDNYYSSLDVSESYDLVNWEPLTFIEEVNMAQAENPVMFKIEDTYYLLAKCWGGCSGAQSTNGVNYYYSNDPIENFTWLGSFADDYYNAPEVNIFEEGTYLFTGIRSGWMDLKRLEIGFDHEVILLNNVKPECSIMSSSINPEAEEIPGDGVDNNCDGEVL